MMLVVADAGPLIVFARSGHLPLLQQVVGELVISQTVFAECTLEPQKPGATTLALAAKNGVIQVHADASEHVLQASAEMLDAGERSALALALHLQCTVLVDERIGRSVAQLHQIPVIGSIGTLILAKRRGLIEQISSVPEAWENSGYFLSAELKAHALELAGETVS